MARSGSSHRSSLSRLVLPHRQLRSRTLNFTARVHSRIARKEAGAKAATSSCTLGRPRRLGTPSWPGDHPRVHRPRCFRVRFVCSPAPVTHAPGGRSYAAPRSRRRVRLPRLASGLRMRFAHLAVRTQPRTCTRPRAAAHRAERAGGHAARCARRRGASPAHLGLAGASSTSQSCSPRVASSNGLLTITDGRYTGMCQ